MEKHELRTEIKNLRDGMSPNVIAAKSKTIFDKVLDLQAFRKSESIMIYASFGSEVSTFDFIEKCLIIGKKVILPKCIKYNGHSLIKTYEIENMSDDLIKSKFGILEPDESTCIAFDKSKIDIILLPGLAFDKRGHRLGYGAGYYDRFLSGKINPLTIGIAFEEQVVEHIPSEDHDIPVDLVITDERIIQCHCLR